MLGVWIDPVTAQVMITLRPGMGLKSFRWTLAFSLSRPPSAAMAMIP
jgi:hypothetical protein